MARISPKQAREAIKATKGSAKVFRFEVGKRYVWTPLGEKLGDEVVDILLMKPTHYVRSASKDMTVRCGNVDKQLDVEKALVVKTDANGELLRDANGVPLNDGTCPFCVGREDFFKAINEQYDKNIELVGEESAAAIRKTQIKSIPIGGANFERFYAVAVFEMDGNQPVLGDDGLPIFHVEYMKLTDNQLTTKIGAIENIDIDSIAFTLFRTVYPDNEETGSVKKMKSAKDAVYKIEPNDFLTGNEALMQKLHDTIEKIDFESDENALYNFRLLSLGEMSSIMDNIRSTSLNRLQNQGKKNTPPPKTEEEAKTKPVTEDDINDLLNEEI